MDSLLKRVGKNIKKSRLSQNITQSELAYRSSLQKNYISDVERGSRNVSLKSLEKISNGLNVEIKQLFEFDN